MNDNPSTVSYSGKLDALEWLAKRGISVDASGYPSTRIGHFRTAFAITPQARSQLMVAWNLAKLFARKNGLFLVTDWPLYKDSEMELYTIFRAKYVDARSLIDVPAFVFEAAGNDGLKFVIENIFLLLAFNWQGFIFSADKSVTVWLADEVVEVWTMSPDAGNQIDQMISDLNLKKLD